MEAKPMQAGNGQKTNPHSMWRKFALAVAFIATLVLATGGETVHAAARADVQKASAPQRFTLVLDAGHGGNDPGAIDPVNGYLEADIAQHVVDRLVPMFEAHKDELQLVLAHEAGENPNVTQRAEVANAVDADLLVSLHLNAATRTTARGFSVYPTPPGRAYHEDSLRAAQSIIGHVRETDLPIMGENENGVYYCFYRGGDKDLYDSAVYAGMSPIDRNTFGVLQYSDCPSILVEQWFITNPEDMAMFNNTAGKDLMAEKIYRGICDYFGIEAIY